MSQQQLLRTRREKQTLQTLWLWILPEPKCCRCSLRTEQQRTTADAASQQGTCKGNARLAWRLCRYWRNHRRSLDARSERRNRIDSYGIWIFHHSPQPIRVQRFCCAYTRFVLHLQSQQRNRAASQRRCGRSIMARPRRCTHWRIWIALYSPRTIFFPSKIQEIADAIIKNRKSHIFFLFEDRDMAFI